MATIKDTIQIDGYENMTAEEKVAALEAMAMPELDKSKYIDKAQFDKKTSELAEANRKLRDMQNASLSDEEKKARERQAFEDEKKQFNRHVNEYEVRNIFASNDMQPDDYADFDISSFDDKDAAVRFANSIVKLVKAQRGNAEQAVRSSILGGSTPPASGASANEAQALQQMYADAKSKNDSFTMAKAIRKASEKGVSLQL